MSTKKNETTLKIVNETIKSSPALTRELGGPLTADNVSRLASLSYEGLNEFIGAILKVVKTYAYTTIFERIDNPFAPFFKEKLEAGFTVEDLYIKLFDGHDFDYTGADALKRHKPDVVDLFYSINFEKEYDISVSLEQSRTAFLSLSGIEQFMAQQYNSLFSSAERDIWKKCLEIFGDVYANGDYYNISASALSSDANIKSFLETLKNTISGFQFLGSTYNPLSTDVKTRPEDVLIIMPANVKNKIDVQILAGAFNLDKIEVRNQIITVPASSAFGAKLASEGTLAIVVDKNFFRIYPQTFDTLAQLNASGFFTNTHLLSRWIFSYGRFYNIARIYDASATYHFEIDNKTADSVNYVISAPTVATSPYHEGDYAENAIILVAKVGFETEAAAKLFKATVTDGAGNIIATPENTVTQALGGYVSAFEFNQYATDTVMIIEDTE